MNVLVLGDARSLAISSMRSFHNIRHISDIANITIPFPFNGKLYYNGTVINCADYDCAVFFQIGKNADRIFRVLEGHMCVLGDPHIRTIMMDKLLSSVILYNAGLPVVNSTFCASEKHDVTAINSDKIVGKPVDGAFGNGIWLREKDSIKKHISPNYILQPYIECNSSDERLIIVGGKLVCAMERRSGNKDEFRSNIDLGGVAKRLELTDERMEVAEKIGACFPNHLLIGADILRSIDGKWYIGEVNARPGFHIIEITGHNFFKDISIYIEEEAKKWAKEKI